MGGDKIAQMRVFVRKNCAELFGEGVGRWFDGGMGVGWTVDFDAFCMVFAQGGGRFRHRSEAMADEGWGGGWEVF